MAVHGTFCVARGHSAVLTFPATVTGTVVGREAEPIDAAVGTVGDGAVVTRPTFVAGALESDETVSVLLAFVVAGHLGAVRPLPQLVAVARVLHSTRAREYAAASTTDDCVQGGKTRSEHHILTTLWLFHIK